MGIAEYREITKIKVSNIMTYSIHKATTNDDKILCKLNRDGWFDAYSKIFDHQIIDTLPTIITADGYQKALSKSHNIYLLRADNIFIGFASFGTPRQEITGIKNSTEVYALYLIKSYWRCGAGSKFLELIENEIKLLFNSQIILIWTLEQNIRAKRFYEKNGYVKTNNTKMFTMSDFEYPEILFIKQVV